MSRVVSGPKISAKINGVKVAFASGINITQDNALTNIDVLDQLEPAEFAETGHLVTFSINLFKIDENAAAKFGLDPNDLNEVLTQPELTFEAYNRISDKVEYEITGVKFSGGTGTLDARGVWQGVYNFSGRRGKGL